jgi:cytochrome c553
VGSYYGIQTAVLSSNRTYSAFNERGKEQIMRSIIVLTLLAGTIVFAQTPAFQPVATVGELMQAIVIPTSDAVFGAAGETPKNEEEWTALENSALMLAESGNLLMMRSPSGDTSIWLKESKAMVEAGSAAYQAAKAKNVDGVLEAGDKIYESCAGCHEKHLQAK